MNKSWLDFLSPNELERKQVIIMLVIGFLFGTFIATFQVASESLFLNHLSKFSDPNLLNKAFLVSGLLGIVSTLVFTILQNRIKFISLVILSVAIIVATTTSIYYLYKNGDPKINDIVLFGMFCLAGPTQAVLLLCYWGIFGRLFNFKQSKRIIGWIDTGQLIAIIVANFFIPLTAFLFPNTIDYLVVCNISIIGSLACFIYISTRFRLIKNNPKEFDVTVREETKFKNIFKDKYILMVSVFLVISMVTFICNQYSFQTLLNQQYPDQRDLTNFLAYFNATIYVLSLVMQTFVNDKILSTYGVRVSLFFVPVVTGLFAIGSFVTGAFFGYTPEGHPLAFVIFLSFIALSRLFNSMLRDSLENPVFKLLFIPLDSRYRFGVQTKVEGVVGESGRFIAGLLVFGFSSLILFKIYWIPFIVLVLAGIYFMLAEDIYNGYRNKIQSKLESSEFHQDNLEVGFKKIVTSLESRLTDGDISRAIFSFKLLEKINPSDVAGWVNVLAKNEQEEVQGFAQRRMNEMKGLSVSENYVIRIDKNRASSEGKNILSSFDLEQMLKNGGEITKARLIKLARSSKVGDRQYAAELLLHTTSDDSTLFLTELLVDTEPKVRKTALATASKKFNTEVINAVIENLNNPQYSNLAMDSLTLMGSAALNPLDAAFYRNGQNAQTMIRIIQVMGIIGGQRAKDLLWSKIDYPDKVIVSQVLLALGECGFKAGISQITRIKFAIEADIADLAWNLNAIKDLGDGHESLNLRQALRQEINHDVDHLYMLLAMLYDTRSIQLVKENIESGTSEGTTYAVELLDVFLSEQLKMKVIPVLDDISDSEKISRLEMFYPRILMDEKLVLKFLINRDFTQTNLWTKATVVHEIGTKRISDFKMDLIAQLFNPDRLIREIAGWALYQIDRNEFMGNSARLDEDHCRWLRRAVLKENKDSKLMLFEKASFFQGISVFEGVPGITLSYLADIAKEVKLKKEETLTIDERSNNDFFIVYSGVVHYYQKGKYIIDFVIGQFVGEMVAPPTFINSNLLVAKDEVTLLKINKDQFYELLSDDVKLADRVLLFI